MTELKDKKCEICGKEFFNRRKNGKSLGDSQFLKARFCSIKCSAENQKGKHKPFHTENWKKEASKRLKKQHILGLRRNIFTLKIRKKMSESRLKGIKEGRITFWNKG